MRTVVAASQELPGGQDRSRGEASAMAVMGSREAVLTKELDPTADRQKGRQRQQWPQGKRKQEKQQP